VVIVAKTVDNPYAYVGIILELSKSNQIDDFFVINPIWSNLRSN